MKQFRIKFEGEVSVRADDEIEAIKKAIDNQVYGNSLSEHIVKWSIE